MSMSDVAIDNKDSPQLVSLHLRHAKTDQLGKGAYIYLSRTNNDQCPVAALLAYIAVRGQDPGPLFRLANGSPLLKEQFVRSVREALLTLAYNGASYAGHSFRIGAATTAAAAGVEDSTIQILGRWSSDAFKRYIRLSQEDLAKLSARMASATGAVQQ